MSPIGGLYWVPLEEYVPGYVWRYLPERKAHLTAVNVEACVVDTSAEVRIVQTFVNPNPFPVEAIYVFPLDEQAAVCEFEAEIAGRKVVGVAKSKEVANAEYQEAVKQGHGAYLLEEVQPEIFRAKIGNLPGSAVVSISTKYVTELKNELEKIRFVVPTHIAPRYTPVGSAALPSSTVDDAYKGIHLNVTCVSQAGFSAIESPSHNITSAITGNTASVGLSQGITYLEKDFVLLVTYASPHEPKVFVEETQTGDYAAMVTLFPHLQFASSKTELIFVVDRSGSMSPKVQELRDALSIFMRSLPVDCFFNIIGFGSSYSQLMPNSRRYDDETLAIASKHIPTISADLGGTEILEPLQYIFSLPPIPGYARQVFLLTDGEVSNTDQVIALVGKNRDHARVFALGIGNSVSHQLVEGVARAGGGTAFFALEGERIEKKVLKQLQDATQPALNKVQVDWGIAQQTPTPTPPVGEKVLSLLSHTSPSVDKPQAKLQQAPFRVPPIFSDNHFRIYALFSSTSLPEKVKISAQSVDGLLQVELPIDPTKIIKGNLLHTLAARSLIRDLEEGSSYLHSAGFPPASIVRDEIIRLGTKFQLASKFTSFIAIEERDRETWLQTYQQPPPPPVQPSSYSSYAPSPASSAKLRATQQQIDQVRDVMAANIDVVLKRGQLLEDIQERSADLSSQSHHFAKGSKKTNSWGGSISKSFSSMTSSVSSAISSVFSSPPPAKSFAPAEERRSRAAPRPISISDEAMPEAEGKDEDFFEEEQEEKAAPAPPSPKAAPAPAPSLSKAAPAPSLLKADSQPSAVPKSPPKDPRQLLVALLNLQSALGTFALTQELANALGLGLSVLRAEQANLPGPIDASVTDRVWGTALALAFLNKKLKDLSDEWLLAAGKAQQWLRALNLPQLANIQARADALV